MIKLLEVIGKLTKILEIDFPNKNVKRSLTGFRKIF